MAFNLDSISEFGGYIAVEWSSIFLIKRSPLEASFMSKESMASELIIYITPS